MDPVGKVFAVGVGGSRPVVKLFDYQNYEAWVIWAHIRYLSGDFRGAKERYERILQFPELPADQTHSIYIRLASIYLKEENVSWLF